MGPVIIKNKRVLEEAWLCIQMRTGHIYQSPWLTLSFWPALEVHIHIHACACKNTHLSKEGEGHSKNSLIFLFQDVYSYLCYTYITITEAISDWNSSTKLNIGLCLVMSKSYVRKIIKRNGKRGVVTNNLHDTIHLLLKAKQSIVSFDFKEKCTVAVMQENWIPNMPKDVDFLRPQCTDNGFTNNSLIMIFTLYNDFLWQIAYDHKVIQS